MAELDTNVSATALKALGVLDFVGEQRRPVTVAEVAERHTGRQGHGLPHADDFGAIGLCAEGRRFEALSADLQGVVAVATSRQGGRARAPNPRMHAPISEETGETVHYSVLERDAAVLVYRVKGTQRVAVDFQVGDRSPLHCSSIGKVLLAFQDVRATEAVLARGLPKVAPNTITDPETLRRSLARIRSDGYAFDDLEFAPDMRCVALPVFEKGGEVPGGLAISGPASRFDSEKLASLRDIAMVHATALSRELGGLF